MFNNKASVRTAARTAMAAAAAIGALALPCTASADLGLGSGIPCKLPSEEVRDTTGPDYNVRLCGVSDIDQKRADLWKGGNVYCGPASLFNVLNYFTHRQGIPVVYDAVNPAPDWYLADIDPLDPADYDRGTSWLGIIGAYAGLDADGSRLGGNRQAADTLTAKARASGWKFWSGVIDSNKVSEFGYEMAKLLRNGPLQMSYGRYKGTNILQRDGGHIVTVVSAKGTIGSGQVELTLADPGRSADNDLYTQSAYRYEKVTLKKVSFWAEHLDADVVTDTGGSGGGGAELVTRWELTGENYKPDPANPTRQMVEGFNWFYAFK